VLGELLPPLLQGRAVLDGLEGRAGGFATAGPVLYLPFLAGAGLAFAGAVRPARLVLGAVAAIAAALPAASWVFGVNRPPLGLVAALGWCALLSALGLRRPRGAGRAVAARPTVSTWTARRSSSIS
jgi:hypothetical protein